MGEFALTLALAGLAGFAGSVHCMGMCGAFVLEVGAVHTQRPWFAQFVYAFGRACAYGLLGALFALAGGFVALAAAIADLQGWFSLAAGAAIVVLGGRRLAGAPEPGWLRALPDRLHRSLARTRGLQALFAFGALNALVPCGLLVTMELRAAAAANVMEGFALMFVFALGTAPALVALGAMGARLMRMRRPWLDRFASIVLMLLGLQIALRGAAHLGWVEHSRWF